MCVKNPLNLLALDILLTIENESEKPVDPAALQQESRVAQPNYSPLPGPLRKRNSGEDAMKAVLDWKHHGVVHAADIGSFVWIASEMMEG